MSLPPAGSRRGLRAVSLIAILLTLTSPGIFPRAAADSGSNGPSDNNAGNAPQTHTVTLNWQPSDSQVVGYNIYRGVNSGGPYTRINSTIDPDTTFIDNGALGGQTYYYVTTAVNSAGQESSYSNEAEVAVP